MIDRLLSAALAFCLLVAGTLAIGTAMFEETPQVVTMPRVVVIGKRAPAQAQLALAHEAQASSQARTQLQ
jgi:hypothetical protein